MSVHATKHSQTRLWVAEMLALMLFIIVRLSEMILSTACRKTCPQTDEARPLSLTQLCSLLGRQHTYVCSAPLALAYCRKQHASNSLM